MLPVTLPEATKGDSRDLAGKALNVPKLGTLKGQRSARAWVVRIGCGKLSTPFSGDPRESGWCDRLFWPMAGGAR